jgi:hypothetical protein
MNTALTPPRNIQAGAEFVKKFPKSPASPVATYLVEEIGRTTEPDRESHCHNRLWLHLISLLRSIWLPYQIDGLIQQNKLDEGFAEGAK